nr:non-reducing polyketide synthase [Calonarius rufo-olivaceus]
MPPNTANKAAEIPPFEPIAIIGMGVRGPGGINSLNTLWDTLVERKSHCFPLAKDPRFQRRFDPEDFKALFDGIPDSENVLHSNLFDETPGLDRSYFSLSEREAAGMDVQQKLLLHVAHEALEDAGYSGVEDGSAFDPSTFGVYVATATDEVIQDPRDYDTDIYHLVRTERAFLSGQICFHFGLRGPSSSVDTVCSGSITAINDACRALATGDCRAAIAGGVHVVTPVSGPISFYCIKRAGFLDRTGQCKPFLHNGTGYARSEGCGLVVMKRLSDAIREGDRIHGVIRGLCIRSMASPKFISQPNGSFQSVALAQAVKISGVDPAAISFVEAHGPGTAKGDLAEVSSLCSVLAQHRAPDNPVTVGSLKGNVGHAEAASGTHSLAKVLAMFQRRRIPPQADFHPSRLNPTLQPFFDKYPIRIIENEEAWTESHRIAVVGNFGASGNAGFMVVEEGSSFQPLEGRDTIKVSTPLPFVISAKEPSTLIKLIHLYIDWLKLPTTMLTPLSDISYAMTARRFIHPFMISVQADSHMDLVQKLQERAPMVDSSTTRTPRAVAFCFSGQGGERVDPRDSTLYNFSASFTDAVDMCFRLAESENLIAEEDVSMLELFALEFGLMEMWKSWGINPVALAGHSFGEYVALVCAGVLTVRDALKLLGIRAALIRARCLDVPGKMAAVRLPLSDIKKCLEQQKSTHVELACINSDNSVTLAGTPEELESFRQQLLKSYPSATWHLLNNMTAAFHSRFVQPVLTDFTTACSEVEVHPSQLVVLSGLLGKTCSVGDEALQQPDYLVRHCRETNRFGTAISDYQRRNVESETPQPDWLEIGSHSRIISFISLASDQLKFPSHGKTAGDGWTTALSTLMKLYSAGHVIDFKGLHRDINPSAHHTELPLYPFQLDPHFYPVRRAAKAGSTTLTSSDAVQLCPRVPSSELAPLLLNHVMAGYTLCPATTHLALFLAATATAPSSSQVEGRLGYKLSKIKVIAGFTNTTDGWLQVRRQLPSTDMQIISDDDNKVHITGRGEVCKEQDLLESLSLYKQFILPLKSLKSLPSTDVVKKELAYSLFNHTVNYGVHGQILDRVWIAEDGYRAWGYSTYPGGARTAQGVPSALRDFSPMLIESACQLIGFLMNTSADRKDGEAFVTDELGECSIAVSRLYETKHIDIYASFKMVDNGTAGLGHVYAFDDKGQMISAFRDVRMAKMKIYVLKRLIDRGRKPGQAVPTQQVAPAEVESEDNVGNDDFDDKVASILQAALRISELPRDKSLSELGLDSLTAIDVGVQLERLVPNRRDHLTIDPECTLTALLDLLRPAPSTKPITSSTKESNVPNGHLEEKVVSTPPSLPITTNGTSTKPNGVPIPANVVPSIPDPSQALVADLSPEMIEAISTNPEVIQYAPGRMPLLLIHDGGGTAFAYYSLGNLDRTVIGIHCPGLQEGQGIPSVHEATKEYAAIARQYLKQNCPGYSKLLVGGWSLGGTISLTMAALFPDLVAGVVTIDTTPPGVVGLTAAQAESVLLHPWSRTDGIHGLVRRQLQMNTRASFSFPQYQTIVRVTTVDVPVYALCAIDPFIPDKSLGLPKETYEWLLTFKQSDVAEGTWRKLVGERLIGIDSVPGNHWTMFIPANVKATTEGLRRGVDAIENWLNKRG